VRRTGRTARGEGPLSARRRLLVLVGALFAAALASAPPASAHAQLEGTVPSSGQVLSAQPAQIVFRFSEAVESSFGAVRVYDAKGAEIQRGQAFHPGGAGDRIAVRLRPGLPKGTYTATYRIISADSHPVSGGAVFSVGRAGRSGATVSDLLARRGSTGPATEVGFGVVRGLQYASIAAAVGGVVFLFAVWLPGLAAVAGGGERWRSASEAFAHRLRSLLLWAAAAGAATAALGLVFQGATARGSSLSSALDVSVIDEVLGTRFGTVWGLRLVAWVLLALAAQVSLAPARRPVLRSASVGATGLALPARAGDRASVALLSVPLAFLVISPALAGHASVTSPSWLGVPANVVHVLSMSVWAGGLVVLLAALPVATRALEGADRTRLLAATLARFSTLAGLAVAALLLTGVIQGLIEVRAIDELASTAFGRAVLVKSALLVSLLIPLGAYNRRVSVPTLRRLAAGGETPGRAGVLLRRTVRAEVALVVVVLGVTAALVSYAPAYTAGAPSGPAEVTKALGPADAQLTVDPARVGPNDVHLYLTDRRTGQPWDRTKELTVTLALPEKRLGPLKQSVRKAGPGHFIVDGATFGVPGDWRVALTSRVSDFDEYAATADVRIR
jgi:copper transport protein